MNKQVFSEIYKRYKDRFDYFYGIDGWHEGYKWPAVRCCIDNWDIDSDDFADMFKRSMNLSKNIIENRIKHPINGIMFLCEQGKTEQIREAFRMLLADDGGDISRRQKNAETFLDNINAMLKEIAPEKWSFIQDRRDPLMYLAFIKPESSYMFMAEQSRVFSNYVEFDDDIGSGQTFKFENYYRLCDEVLTEIQSDEELKQMLDEKLVVEAKKNAMSEESLLDIPGKYRISVYDIMYCAYKGGLYKGMASPVKRNSKEGKERERKKRIEEIYGLIESQNSELEALMSDIPAFPDLMGAELSNIKYGKGKVTAQENQYLFLEFNEGEKKYALPDCITKGFLSGAGDDVKEVCKVISDIDLRKKQLASSLTQLSRELSVLE